MSPVGDITIYESQLFRAYSAPTAAVRDFHSKTLRTFTLQPKKEPHELHLHRPVRRRYSLHRMDKLSGKAPESPQQRQKRSQIHKTKRPVTLVYYEGYATKEAMSREYAIKQLTGKKLALMEF